MTSENETMQSKQLLKQIQYIKEHLRAEREHEIQKIKEEYKEKERQQINDLNQKRKKLLYRSLYEKNHKSIRTEPSRRDILSQELFNLPFKELSREQKNAVLAMYTRERRKKEKNSDRT